MTLTAADIGVVIDIATRAAREAVNSAGTGGGGLSLPVPVLRPATVGDSAPTGTSVAVVVDGDVAPITALNLTGWALSPGARVQVMFTPPHGVYVTSIFDPPHTVGLWWTSTPITGLSGLSRYTPSAVSFNTTPMHYYRCQAGGIGRGGTHTYFSVHIEDQDANWIAQSAYLGPGDQYCETTGVISATAGEMTVYFGYDFDGSGNIIGPSGPGVGESTYLAVEDLGPIPAPA